MASLIGILDHVGRLCPPSDCTFLSGGASPIYLLRAPKVIIGLPPFPPPPSSHPHNMNTTTLNSILCIVLMNVSSLREMSAETLLSSGVHTIDVGITEVKDQEAHYR